MKKVSIIIPCYNVEKFLARCLDSVINQTYKDLEIIVVDDGSPDNSYLIYEDYAKKDKRIKIVKKQNGGLGSARNAGLEVATGDYIAFLDSDDWLSLNTLETIIGAFNQYDVDFVRMIPVCENRPGIPNGAPWKFEPERRLTTGLYDREKIVKELFPKLVAVSPLLLGPITNVWSSVYKRDFLTKYNINFSQGVRYNEDTIFSAKVVYYAKSFYFDESFAFYHYYYNDNSITTTYKKDRWESNKNLYNSINEFFGNVKDYDFKNQIKYFGIFTTLNGLANTRHVTDKKQRRKDIKTIMEDASKLGIFKGVKNLKVGIKQRIVLKLIKLKAAGLYDRFVK